MLEKNMTLDELVEIFYNNYKAYIKKSKENLSKEVQGLNILTSPNKKSLEAEWFPLFLYSLQKEIYSIELCLFFHKFNYNLLKALVLNVSHIYSTILWTFKN